MQKTDYLVIGSGIAGLTFALKMAQHFPERKVTIVTKGDREESNTKYAQGGIAVVLDKEKDSFERHMEDTLVAGDGLCDTEVVEMVVKKAPGLFRELMGWGARFDADKSGELNLGREGGHSTKRVAHFKDITGYEIERALLAYCSDLKNIELLPEHFAVDLITEHHFSEHRKGPKTNFSCYGAYVLEQESGSIFPIVASYTIMAAGGIGQVYGHTTNPMIATGDGVAMAYRAGARIQDMEFVQFHPTALYGEERSPAFLISEAVRGFGAYLVDDMGHRFMPKYDARAELAPRDIVSRSIDFELKRTGKKCVYLDCRHLDAQEFVTHFPNIHQKCLSLGIDTTKDLIPVVPAAHYLCGGIVVDMKGRTTLNSLYACGECARTGLHGANRLASNSLLEALVYADQIFSHLSTNRSLESMNKKSDIPLWDDQGMVISKENVLLSYGLEQLQGIMQNYVGIVRNNRRLKKAKRHLELIHKDVEELYQQTKLNTALCELRNMVGVAHLIIEQSLGRKANKGGFYNADNKQD